MITVAIINQKGGVGKTTTAMNLAAALAESGQETLLVDLDPQANLTAHAGIEVEEGQASVYEVLLAEASIASVIRPTGEKRLSIVPATLDLSAAELELGSVEGKETRLAEALKAYVAETGAKAPAWCVIDCPPSLGVLSLNALSAANRVMVAMQTEFFALQGLAKLMEVIDLVRKYLNPELVLDGIVPCKVDMRPSLTKEVLVDLRMHFGERMYQSIIRPNVKLSEAASHGKSVLAYASDSNGAKDYRALASEFLKRWRYSTNSGRKATRLPKVESKNNET
jgi:chromosome partitioning protein